MMFITLQIKTVCSNVFSPFPIFLSSRIILKFIFLFDLGPSIRFSDQGHKLRGLACRLYRLLLKQRTIPLSSKLILLHDWSHLVGKFSRM